MKSGAREDGTSIMPVLIVKRPEKEATFLQAVFQAEIGMLVHNAQGEVQHAEASIGGSSLILERASPMLPATRCAIRISLKNVQVALELALQNGGESVPLPGSGLGEQAEAAVSDPEGNVWWLVPQNRRPSNEEVQRRLLEQRRQRL
jgi:PhnB protein